MKIMMAILSTLFAVSSHASECRLRKPVPFLSGKQGFNFVRVDRLPQRYIKPYFENGKILLTIAPIFLREDFDLRDISGTATGFIGARLSPGALGETIGFSDIYTNIPISGSSERSSGATLYTARQGGTDDGLFKPEVSRIRVEGDKITSIELELYDEIPQTNGKWVRSRETSKTCILEATPL